MLKQLMKAPLNALVRVEAYRKQLVVLAATALFPLLAHADWYQTLNDEAKKIQAGLYLLAGTVFLIGIIVGGMRWIIARNTGDHSFGFMDFAMNFGIGALVGGAIAGGTYAWQFFGGTMG